MFPQRLPTYMPRGYPPRPSVENTMNNPWPPSPQFEALYHSPQARNVHGHPNERTRSVSESMASPGALPDHRVRAPVGSSAPVTMPYGSPPHVFRSQQDSPFWARHAAAAAAVGSPVNPQGYPHHAGSPTRHPSSLPSNLPTSHPNRNLEQAHFLMQQQPAQSPPKPHPIMPQAYGGNMVSPFWPHWLYKF